MEYKEDIVVVEKLTKRFKNIAAVDEISFRVKKGEVFAFLGPNGAGKTTTIKMLITLLSPTKGEAFIDGHSITKNASAVRRMIGYVPQMLSVDGTLTAHENLELSAKLYDIPSAERKKRIEETLSFLKMEKQAHILVRTFSGGMIRKLEIGQAMLHRPRVLFLDEPTTGLDPLARENVWDHLLQLRDEFGTTVFFSTHYMEEAEERSDRVAVMHQGRISAIGSVSELKEQTHIRNATLNDVFIFFTGSFLQETGSIRETKQTRETERKLG